MLAERGLDVDIEIVEMAVGTRFGDLSEAVDDFRDNLVLPDDADATRELASLLSAWLVTDADDGRLRPPIATLPAAVLSWGLTDAAG